MTNKKIKLLPDSVANQIAAGEVVNRPASVVKELMENAVDAGAESITVNFRDGGRELIQIKDDGVGMSPEDARMAFERHATSKIASVDDIYALSSFGFRGEALPSIAAVAQIELQTRTEDRELGTQLFIDGGAFREQNSVAVSRGTQIFVRNLFYNVPARKKFLDKGSTETSHVISEFVRVALAHPEIAFQLFRDDTPVYNLPAGTLHQRVVGVGGKNAAQKLLEVSVDTSIVRVYGFIGRPASAIRRNKEQYLFVNGRFFKSTFFHKAVIQAYDKLISFAVQPSYFLYFTIDPEQIDVNVHPQKTEIKFTDQAAVWQIINAAVKETLAKSGAVPMLDFGLNDDAAEVGAEGDRLNIPVFRSSAGFAGEPPSVRRHGYNPFSPIAETHHQYDVSQFDYVDGADGLQQSAFESTSGGPKVFSDIVPLGEGYAAALYGDILVVVDLRRAREAVLYDRFVSLLHNGHSATQQLLFPERMVLSADDFELAKDNMGEFAALGFDVRVSGEYTVDILGVPGDMPSERFDEVVYEMLDTLRDGTFSGTETRRERLAAVMARAGSARTKMSPVEVEMLLGTLATTKNRSYSPFGKPVFVEITIDEIKNRLR